MLEGKIFVADQRAQHLLDAARELLSDALERYYRDVRVLDVGPNQVLPVRNLSLGFVGFEYALEPAEVREQNDAIEVIAKNCDFARANNRFWKRRQVRHAQVLTQ